MHASGYRSFKKGLGGKKRGEFDENQRIKERETQGVQWDWVRFL